MKQEAVAKTFEKTGMSLFSAMDEILAEMKRMHDEISKRAFELFKARGEIHGFDLEDWFKAEMQINSPVHFQTNEKDNEINIKAELPEFSPEQLKINIDGRVLTITGRTESTKEGVSSSKQFLRKMTLSSDVDTDNAKATFKDGVLELILPKLKSGSEIKIEHK
ncbi:MAG: Hsp20/alpha crystallin family protein [Acidobacteriota bacterium]|nr:Hsp20/alpha crystallin family protein [Blastocatellia bacterium]MDW8411595.1 Hsp20/alpha crystallin family protein [Acidobacteriota bacterium]